MAKMRVDHPAQGKLPAAKNAVTQYPILKKYRNKHNHIQRPDSRPEPAKENDYPYGTVKKKYADGGRLLYYFHVC